MHRRPLLALIAAPLALLIAPLAGCTNTPKDLDRSTTRLTAERRFEVSVKPLTEPVAINQMHAWEIKVQTPAGAPVRHAQIDVAGGMPEHGHGFPTRPRVTREVSPGVYALEGMKFSMTGWWDLRLVIRAGAATDTAVFNVIVDDAGIRR